MDMKFPSVSETLMIPKEWVPFPYVGNLEKTSGQHDIFTLGVNVFNTQYFVTGSLHTEKKYANSLFR